eukprot:5303254-Amphidinium_carterae.2
MSDLQSAFLNTPVQQGTTILAKPPPKCERDENILRKLNKQIYGLRDSPQRFQQHLSTILKQLVYVDDLLLIGDDDKIKTFLQKLESQLQLKHVTKLQREQPLVFLGRQIEYDSDHIALSMTKEYYKSRQQWENLSTVENIQLIARLWANYFGCVHYVVTTTRHSVRDKRTYKSNSKAR